MIVKLMLKIGLDAALIAHFEVSVKNSFKTGTLQSFQCFLIFFPSYLIFYQSLLNILTAKGKERRNAQWPN